jgi:peptide-methionine (S)-S-oxide reductase
MNRRLLVASVAAALLLGFRASARAQDDAAPTESQEQEEVKAAPEAHMPTAPSSKSKSKKSTTRAKSRTSSADNSATPQSKPEYATFGAGCFWHVEAAFERLPGVISAVSGYAGGHVRFPSYEMVHEGDTGHAEVVMVEFDPRLITYEDLLKVFWSHHDPTTPNQQGPDIGPQYRSIILYRNEAQRKAALKSYEDLMEMRASGKGSSSMGRSPWLWNRKPIVTELVPLKAFYRAEDYHQDYYGGKPRTAARRHKAGVSKARKAQAKPKASTSQPAAEATQPAPSGDSLAPRP